MPAVQALPVYELPQAPAEFDRAAAPSGTPALQLLQPRCTPAPAGEIVVCARDQERDRLRPLPDVSGSVLPKAETRLGDGVVASAHVEQAGVGGWPSNRLMVDLKFGF